MQTSVAEQGQICEQLTSTRSQMCCMCPELCDMPGGDAVTSPSAATSDKDLQNYCFPSRLHCRGQPVAGLLQLALALASLPAQYEPGGASCRVYAARLWCGHA